MVLSYLIFLFCLYRRGTLALRRLCQLLDAERVYRELATILEGEADLEFATIMVQVGSLVIQTSFCYQFTCFVD